MKKYELTIIKRLIRNGKRTKNENLKYNHKVEIDGETYNCFINNYCIMCSAYDDYGFPEKADKSTEKVIKDNMIPGSFSGPIFNENFARIDLDSKEIERLKKFNRENHCHKAFDYILEDGRHIGFNPAYMMDCMKYFKVDYCYYIDFDSFFIKGGYIRPLYFVNKEEKKIGLLLPVNLEVNRKYAA